MAVTCPPSPLPPSLSLSLSLSPIHTAKPSLIYRRYCSSDIPSCLSVFLSCTQ
jgi:hypothetical protein